MLSSTFRLLVLLPFYFTDSLTPLVATIAVAAIPVVGGTVYLRILRKGDTEVPDLVDEARYRGILRYGSRVWIGSISGILLSRLDQTLLTPLAGTFELGLYVVAVSISELPLIINSAVRDVTFVTDAAKRDDERLTASARISTLLCLVAGVFIGASMLWWLPLLFGKDFGDSIPVAIILLVAVVFGTPGSIAGSGLSARGFPALRSWSLAIACILNIIGLIVLAPVLGAVGAALATLLGNLVSSNLNLIFMQRKFGLHVWRFYGIRRADWATMMRFGRTLLRRGR
jgi:O-antigen/teichoic acid export membrane protein